MQVDSIAYPPNCHILKNEGFYGGDFPSKEQVRYLRIKLPDPNRNDNWNETDMSRFKFDSIRLPSLGHFIINRKFISDE